MKELNIPSAYALGKMLNLKITIATIDNFLKGRNQSMKSEYIEIILNALGAEGVKFAKSKKPGKKPD